jgi:hypothetical protein
MSLNPYNINELKKSFDYLVQRNHEVQEDIRITLGSEDYLKAVKTIDKFIKEIDKFIKLALDMAQEFRKTANYENKNICLKAEKMAKKIKIAHLEVEKNMLKKHIKENKSKFKLSLLKSTSQNILGILVTSK